MAEITELPFFITLHLNWGSLLVQSRLLSIFFRWKRSRCRNRNGSALPKIKGAILLVCGDAVAEMVARTKYRKGGEISSRWLQKRCIEEAYGSGSTFGRSGRTTRELGLNVVE